MQNLGVDVVVEDTNEASSGRLPVNAGVGLTGIGRAVPWKDITEILQELRNLTMKARLPKGYGRPDPNAMMRQVQKMQDAIREKQAELEAKEYTGSLPPARWSPSP